MNKLFKIMSELTQGGTVRFETEYSKIDVYFNENAQTFMNLDKFGQEKSFTDVNLMNYLNGTIDARDTRIYINKFGGDVIQEIME